MPGACPDRSLGEAQTVQFSQLSPGAPAKRKKNKKRHKTEARSLGPGRASEMDEAPEQMRPLLRAVSTRPPLYLHGPLLVCDPL